MPTASCPSCGAPVEFKSAASVLAVCGYCTSTLVKRGTVLEEIGKMAALQDDPTLLQIGSEGVYKGVHFGVIGRIQLRYDAGLWNEWHIMFDDQRSGWLGEAAGEFYVNFEHVPALAPPPFEGLHVEDRVDLDGRFFEVSNREEATCIAGQGELPFKVGAGYAAPVVDLRLDSACASIDYSDVEDGGVARVYIGERVNARDLKLAHLRDPKAAGGALVPGAQADVFNCPACAAPFQLVSGRIKTFGCASCGAVLDTASRQVRVVLKAQAALDTPLAIALGARGRLDDIEWQVIGHLRRASEHGFSWSEFLLFNARDGFRWLSESDGHWSFIRTAEKPLKKIGNLAFQGGSSYEHFSHYQAEVTHVLGEFYWKVKVGDIVEVDDYIAPPLIASREKDDRELTWSTGTYVEPAVLRKAFAVNAPWAAPRGVAPNQPSPWQQSATRLWKRFALVTVLALVLQLWFALTTSGVRQEQVTLKPGVENNILTTPIKVTGNGNLALSTITDLDNSWAGLGYTLVDPASGRVWRAEHQLEAWSGVDEDGDRWSEGSNSGLVSFGNVPPGTYQLQIEGELAPEATRPLGAVLRLERGHASWLNWLLLQLGLLTVPLFAGWRASVFEARRWADSDHAPADEDDD